MSGEAAPATFFLIYFALQGCRRRRQRGREKDQKKHDVFPWSPRPEREEQGKEGLSHRRVSRSKDWKEAEKNVRGNPDDAFWGGSVISKAL